MKNIVINNGTSTITVSAAHNVTVSETQITIDLVKMTTRSYTKTKKTTTKSKTKKTTTAKRGRPRKTKA